MNRMEPLRAAPRIHHAIRDIKHLAEDLQRALSLELSTIPPYLCALYSISDNTSMAYSMLRSVVLEEMLHLMQVANLLNAVGARPSLGPQDVPLYPGFMKHHVAGGPFIQLQPFSPTLARDVFMAIEQPESSPKAPPEGGEFETIGQFYKAIELGFECCVEKFGERAVFSGGTHLQRTDTWFGSGGGKLILIRDLESAKRAIKEIVQQGEGAEFPPPPAPGDEEFEDRFHYGIRLDGTYGPILGKPSWDLSHYIKFRQLATGIIPAPPVYPMVSNPAADRFTGTTQQLALFFDSCYTLVLRALETAFATSAVEFDFFAVAFPLMRFVLPAVATTLMQTPIELNANPGLGPTAGPAFQFRARSLRDLVADAEWLQANPITSLGSAYLLSWEQNFKFIASILSEMLPAIAKAGFPNFGAVETAATMHIQTSGN